MEMAITFPLTVAHCDGSSRVWATDGTHWILIYKYSIGSFKRGDVIPAGWSATYTNYNGIHEMVPVDAVPAATSTADITIATTNAADITTDDVNKVLLLENITFSAATAETGAFTGVDAQGNTVSFYNGLKLASVAAGTYNVEIAVSINSSKPSLYPISFTAVPTIALGNYAFTAKPYVLGDETVNDLTLTIDSFVDNVKRGDDATYQLVMTADQASQVIATCDAATKALVAEHLAYNEDATYAINVVDGDNTTAYDLDITSPYINLWLGDLTDNATLNYVNDAATSNVDAYIEIAFTSVAVAEEEALINSLIFTPYVSCPDFENATLQAVDGKKLTYNVVVPAFLTNIPVENGALKLTADDFIGHEGVGGNIYCGYKFLTVVNDEYVANETLFNGDDEGFKFFETLNTSTPTNGVSGIADITTDANAPVEYYNLAGLRLNTPTAPGIYLRRQGTQVSKIIIK
jgi:hypothetical protein